MRFQRFGTVLLVALVTIGCASSARDGDGVAPGVVAPAAFAAWYEPEIRAFEAADEASPPAPGQVLFIGSSSIRMWGTLAEDMAPAPVLNRGFGGSKTGEVLAVFDRIVEPYAPSVIVYYCGDNDLGTESTDSRAAAAGFIEFDLRARSRWPGVRVFYIPIKPSVARWSNWAAMARANGIVREYCQETEGAEYLDTVTPMLGADGRPDPSLFLDDGLHLNEKGYEVWKGVVSGPVVEAWRRRSR
ncbi:MAG TPA: GDSL-type esterase/lipase family protein [Phycisphaerales bacterium]|nr:GDSL-type esterase/lipase family protein [Phycisphaerales bacterium]